MAKLLDEQFYLVHPEYGFYSGMLVAWEKYRWGENVRRWNTAEQAFNFAITTMPRFGHEWLENMMLMSVTRIDDYGKMFWPQKVYDFKDLSNIRYYYFLAEWPAWDIDTISIADVFRQNNEAFDGEFKSLSWYVELESDRFVDFCANSQAMNFMTRKDRDAVRSEWFHGYSIATPIYVMENIFFFETEQDAAMFKLAEEGNHRVGNLQANLEKFKTWITRIWGEEIAARNGW